MPKKRTPTEKPWARGCVISYVIAELLPKKHSKKGRIQLDGCHFPFRGDFLQNWTKYPFTPELAEKQATEDGN